MKTLRFLSVFAIFGILFSCSAPKAPSRTYSTKEVLNKTYVGQCGTPENLNDLTWHAAEFEESGNQFFLKQSEKQSSESAAINGLKSAQKTLIGFDTKTGTISLEFVTNLPSGTYPGVRYKILSETELEKLYLRVTSNGDQYYVSVGTLKTTTN